MFHSDVLLIHMGGLGDMCLSESTFLSLSRHFAKNISALGYPRFFTFFHDYFRTIHSIESAKWLYLFSDYPSDEYWRKIVFVGKDRNGDLRRRWQAMSEEEMIFVDMYPDSGFPAVSLEPRDKVASAGPEPSSELGNSTSQKPETNIHAEDYQLLQLERSGIRTVKVDVIPRVSNRVILYPEAGVTKSKWHHKHFIELYHALRKHSLEVCIFESFGLNLPIKDKVIVENLVDVKTFFEGGGIFVSNDSGMAHFAGMCGLTTITVFSDFNPAIWHPRGKNISLRLGNDRVDVPTMEDLIMKLILDRGQD